ncbi:MAG: helix-turn-helix domain-containing protein [Promethearchaeota archaeon]
MIEKAIERIELVLKNANYETLVLGNFALTKNKFCFDLLVKKDDLIFSIKIFPNIDNINSDIIRDIKSLSMILKSKPILIGIKNRYQKLDDHTIYVREDLPFITLNTFENIINNKYPYILARRGGGVIFLDGELMKKLREDCLLTRKELSEKLGVTKRTLCAYENETMRPSEIIAEKLLDILKSNQIFKKINIFGWPIKLNMDDKELIEEKELTEFEAHVQEIITDIGIGSYWYKKGSIPFKLSLYSISEKKESEGFFPLFSGISEQQAKINEVSFKCLRSFTNLFQKTSVFIVNNDIKIPEGIKKEKIPIVKIKNLEKVDDEEEFIELIYES